ncbi:hypothetical protein FZEAL_7761 [Fusarium zealandicum]|uniref:2EXR domain-containing protein n=1 Tax=Fusarium zealandicum TaxID=1053134 RepID=A0A8H4UG30_9HYPO|nr:hypothetical protein FZEAL_7761 [Fusarium zealandicum]
MSQTFHQFRRLPVEVRNMIWEHTVIEDKGALYPFNFDWCLHFDWNSSRSIKDVTSETQSRPCPPLIQIPIPQAMIICHEAREAAKTWLKKHGIHFVQCPQGHALVRRFDPRRDILYVPCDRWDAFLNLIEVNNNEHPFWGGIRQG